MSMILAAIARPVVLLREILNLVRPAPVLVPIPVRAAPRHAARPDLRRR